MKTFQNNWENYSEIGEKPSNMAVGAVSDVLERAIGDRGNKVFELSNHLGNVLATVSDKKLGRVLDSTGVFAAYYDGQVRSVQDYYAFGWNIPSRKFNTGSYRHGFNGKENDSDIGEQLIQDYGFRIYNPSVGRFLSVDPLASEYPWYTPYQFAGNKPVRFIDRDGLEEAELEINKRSESSIYADLRVHKSIKIINISMVDDIQVKSVIDDMNLPTYLGNKYDVKQTSKYALSNSVLFGGEGTSDMDFSYKGTYDVSYVYDFSQINSNDIIVAVINNAGRGDEGQLGVIDVGAFTMSGHRVIAIQYSTLASPDGRNTLAHEDGHDNGLLHECKHQCVNLMSYKRSQYGNRGGGLNETQYSEIMLNYTYPLLNEKDKEVDHKKGVIQSSKIYDHGNDPKGDVQNLFKALEDKGHTEISYDMIKMILK